MTDVMRQTRNDNRTKLWFSIFFLLIFASLVLLVTIAGRNSDPSTLILLSEDYHDTHFQGIGEKLLHRVKVQPINLVFLIVFLCAIVHTFLVFYLQRQVKKRPHAHLSHAAVGIGLHPSKNTDFVSEILYFFGEVEVVFGLWCIPMLLAITYVYDWKTAQNYVNGLNYNEALFIMVSLALTSTRPILQLAEKWLGKLALLGGNTPSAWWITLLTVGPFLGAVFKESVAMTILAVLLGQFVYKFHPSSRLAYTTLALLFLYVSVAGTLTSFASSAVYFVKGAWNWTTPYMLKTFSWKVLVGIVICNLLYFFILHADFSKLDKNAAQKAVKAIPSPPIPAWITVVHVAALVWIIFNSENTIIALGSFVLFLGFYLATAPHQHFMELLEPMMVGFFLASLIILTGLQIWWIDPLLSNLGYYSSFIASMFISAFVHNTSANILYTHIPNLSDPLKYFLFSGTMVGGALTIMSNGPNIIGYTILSKYFDHSISLKKLFFVALWPTLIMALIFAVF